MNNDDIQKFFEDKQQWISGTDGRMMRDALEPDKTEHGVILEIGTGSGLSSAFMATLKPKWDIYTIDNHIGEVKNQIDFDQYPHVTRIIANSTELEWDMPLDFIFIDGDHSYEGVKADFEKYSPFLKKGGKIMFHDYWRHDYGVNRFVHEICGNDYRLIDDIKAALVEKL